MARIRSVHPGLWTDERFASASPLARLLFIGIWNECDDAGSFEWSPIKLKMRILPADNADASALLEELEAAGCVMRYTADGRKLGAVRNFTRYQRPKKPNSVYPQADDVRNYCGSEPDPVRNQLPTASEIAPQREKGGGKGSSEPNGSGAEPPVIDPEKIMFDSGVALLRDGGKSDREARSLLGKWKKDHGSGEVIAMIGRAKREGAPDPAAFIEGAWRHKAKATRASASGEFALP